ncbi:MAG: lipid-A-disaccharide synthase N-terminal domain-containing protein [Candidatus Saelkia tenebricola]|nr:lipid-A-disaccharide synthase N-terminal domain-containing protein [Candidatus Saelkia tenebricola]
MNIGAWYIVGFLGQGMFFMRFLYQWIASEKKGKSVIPIQFWYFSISGSLLILVYAIYRKDPVFILGQSMGMLIYTRNLHLIYKEKLLSPQQ